VINALLEYPVVDSLSPPTIKAAFYIAVALSVTQFQTIVLSVDNIRSISFWTDAVWLRPAVGKKNAARQRNKREVYARLEISMLSTDQ
jgi:hypothetical protein